MKSVDLMSLWNAVCSVRLCFSVRKRMHPLDEIRPMRLAGEFFSHRTHRFYRIFLRTVSNSQNASDIQISQSVTANEDTNKEAKAAYIQPIGVSR